MELVLRAYDHDGVLRAESLPVERLWTLLESGGLRDAKKVRVGLDVPPDVFARETIVARLESLIQEGYGEASLTRLRGGEPLDLATLRRAHWPPIGPEEAVALREDMVRYMTYGLWQAPEDVVVHALATLTGQPDASFLLGSAEATNGLQRVLAVVDDDAAFGERFGPAVRAALSIPGNQPDEATLHKELAGLQQLLGPAGRIVRGARAVGLRVIAYADARGSDGLTRFLAEDMTDEVSAPQSPNGNGSYSGTDA